MYMQVKKEESLRNTIFGDKPEEELTILKNLNSTTNNNNNNNTRETTLISDISVIQKGGCSCCQITLSLLIVVIGKISSSFDITLDGLCI